MDHVDAVVGHLCKVEVAKWGLDTRGTKAWCADKYGVVVYFNAVVAVMDIWHPSTYIYNSIRRQSHVMTRVEPYLPRRRKI